LTILEAINLSAEYLNGKGIESARTNAEILLAFILGCKRLDLYLAFERPMNENETIQYRSLLKRRASFEPLQYITGSVEFYGLIFKVNKNVLIPRPETEILVEKILTDIEGKENITLLDIGCGSGCIGISLAAKLPGSKIICTEVNEDAINLAKENSVINKVEDKMKFLIHNILCNELEMFPEFNIIVSNPPYVSLDEYKTLQKEIVNYEPENAVTDGKDGFTFFRAITAKAKSKLRKNGRLYFEVGEGQYQKVSEIMKDNSFENISVVKDYQNINRIITGELY